MKKKNKLAFTLVELLAVIIILGIILAIAVPKVLSTIEDSSKRLFQISVDSLTKEAIKQYVKDDQEAEYTITDGAFVGKVLEVNGKIPDKGTIIIDEDGNIAIAVHNDKYCVKKRFDEDDMSISSDILNCNLEEESTPEMCFWAAPVSETEVRIAYWGKADNVTCPSDVVIPSVFEGKEVVAISEYGFEYDDLTSVVIPNSVRTIGDYAFEGNQITNLTLGNGLISIGNRAFVYNEIENLVIPNSVIDIGYGAFSWNQIKNLTIGNNVATIGDNAFDMNQIKSVVIPSSLKVISDFLFSCNPLTSIFIPEGITTIKYMAFYNSHLTSIVFPESVKTLEDSLFHQNDQLASVTISSDVSIETTSIHASFYTSYVTVNGSVGGIYTAPDISGPWTKQ